MLHTTVQDKCRRISVCLSKLDNRLVATNLNHMLWADMVRGLERMIRSFSSRLSRPKCKGLGYRPARLAELCGTLSKDFCIDQEVETGRAASNVLLSRAVTVARVAIIPTGI